MFDLPFYGAIAAAALLVPSIAWMADDQGEDADKLHAMNEVAKQKLLQNGIKSPALARPPPSTISSSPPPTTPPSPSMPERPLSSEPSPDDLLQNAALARPPPSTIPSSPPPTIPPSPSMPERPSNSNASPDVAVQTAATMILSTPPPRLPPQTSPGRGRSPGTLRRAVLSSRRLVRRLLTPRSGAVAAR